MADFRIRVIVDPSQGQRQIRQLSGELAAVEQLAGRIRRTLINAFAITGISLSIREIIRLSDALTGITNRVRLVTRDTAQLNAVMGELFKISKSTRVGFESTAELYNRTALAVRDLGLTQRETLQFTESLNQAIVLSGATATEANNALIQLSQGLASGVLRGDELRSVLEQLPRVADVIAQRLGVTRGELRILGQQGRISAEEIILAFRDARAVLAEQFKTTIPTIGQAFDVLKTSVILFIHDSQEVQNILQGLARAIIILADNLDVVAKGAQIAGSFLAVNFARQGVGAAIIAIRGLTAAIAVNPIGFLLVTITGAIIALSQFQDEISITSTGVANLGDFFSVLGDRVEDFSITVINRLTSVLNFLSEFFAPVVAFFEPVINLVRTLFDDIEVSLGGFLILTARLLDRWFGLWRGTYAAIIAIFRGLPGAIGSFVIDAVNATITKIQQFINSVISAINILPSAVGISEIDLIDIPLLENNFENNFSNLGKIAADAFSQNFTVGAEDAVKRFLNDVEQKGRDRVNGGSQKQTIRIANNAGLDDRPERVDRLPEALKEQLRLLDQEAKLLKLNNREREVQNRLLDIEEALRTQNVILNDAQRALVLTAVKRNQTLQDQANLIDELRGPQEDLIRREEALRALYTEGKVSLQEFNRELVNMVIAQSQLNIDQGQGTFVDGFLVGIERMLEATRNFESEAGQIFASFFEGVTQGFGDAIGNAIVFGDSIEESLGNAARQALAGLISQLVQLGIQYVLNATLGETLAASATAAGVAQAATLSAAFAPAAALASLASFGSNAAPAQLGIASTVALAQASAIPAFADGGFVSGSGGPRSDSIPAMLSNGEFVVNARATSRFRPVLERMNSPSGYQDGGMVGQGQSNQQGGNQPQQGGNIRIVNLLDPSIVGDFLESSNGDRVILNSLQRNAKGIQQILRNN